MEPTGTEVAPAPTLEEELEFADAQEKDAWRRWAVAQDHRRKIQEAILKRDAAR